MSVLLPFTAVLSLFLCGVYPWQWFPLAFVLVPHVKV